MKHSTLFLTTIIKLLWLISMLFSCGSIERSPEINIKKGVKMHVKAKKNHTNLSHIKIETPEYYNTLHHTENGYTNIWGKNEHPPISKGMGWMFGFLFNPPKTVKLPMKKVSDEKITAHTENISITWIGHSSFLIKYKNMNILTDPVFSERVSPVSFAGPKRVPELPWKISELPPIDFVIISHNHYDHMDTDSLEKLQKLYAPIFLVALDNASIFRGIEKYKVLELDWWQYVTLAKGEHKLRFHCTPAKHFSSRGLTDRDKSLWAGWAIEIFNAKDKNPVKSDTNVKRIFFAGDTAYSEHFSDIRNRLGKMDVAFLPIGAYEPRSFMRRVHMNPDDAINAFYDLQAREFVGMHWGTFLLAGEPFLDPPKKTLEAATRLKIPSEKIHILPIGGQVLIH